MHVVVWIVNTEPFKLSLKLKTNYQKGTDLTWSQNWVNFALLSNFIIEPRFWSIWGQPDISVLDPKVLSQPIKIGLGLQYS